MRPYLLRAAALLAILMSAGCTAIRYQPVHADSQRPLSLTPNCKTSATEAITHLPEGGQCMVLVQANQWLSYASLKILPGEAYLVTVPPGQAWFDLNRRSAPPRGDVGNWVMNVLASQKRHPGAHWFALIATAISTDTNTPVELPGRQDISNSGVFKVRYAGTLAFYPNDAIGPAADPMYYYKNNAGQIWVTVARLRSRTQ
jgi:hypothetical protein